MKNFSAAIEETQRLLKVLQTLKQASSELRVNSNSSSAMKSLLELKLENESDSVLSIDPHLSNLSTHLSNLKSIKDSSQHHQCRLKSFLTRQLNSHEISRLATVIDSEIQSWFDRQALTNLINELHKIRSSGELIPETDFHEDSLIKKIEGFTSCLTNGFDLNLQDLLLKSNIFSELEYVLANENMPKQIREKVAYALKCLVLFNKDVFVGQVLMGQTIPLLIKIGSLNCLDVLREFIKAIKSPLVDEIESFGGITKVVNKFCCDDVGVKIMAMECVLDIGCYGRKEAIESMLKSGVIKRLMELQRWGQQPLLGCVARFAVQLEVGEGLRRREKRVLKQEIVKRIREASVSDAEAASVIAEVLWCCS